MDDKRPEGLLLTSAETARRLSISERTLWTLTAPRGSLPCVRFGRSVRYCLADVLAFINQHSERVAH